MIYRVVSFSKLLICPQPRRKLIMYDLHLDTQLRTCNLNICSLLFPHIHLSKTQYPNDNALQTRCMRPHINQEIPDNFKQLFLASQVPEFISEKSQTRHGSFSVSGRRSPISAAVSGSIPRRSRRRVKGFPGSVIGEISTFSGTHQRAPLVCNPPWDQRCSTRIDMDSTPNPSDSFSMVLLIDSEACRIACPFSSAGSSPQR